MLIKMAVAAATCLFMPARAGLSRVSAAGHDGFQRKPGPETVESGPETRRSRATPRPRLVTDTETDLPAEPGAPGTFWRDSKGCRRQVPDWPVRRAVNPHEATLRFVEWLRSNGFDGWMLSEDVGGFYSWFCRDEGFEELLHDELRASLADLPGVSASRRRINGPQFEDLRRYLARIGRLKAKADLNRFELYRIASHEEMAAPAAPQQRRAA